jgi:hypothetical protein
MHERFDGKRAWNDLSAICAMGPRPTGSPPLEQLRRWIERRLHGLGWKTCRQSFSVTPRSRPDLAETGENLIASHRPNDVPRVLLGTHIDTRPIADQETNPADRQRPILGANDGASGAAVLIEIARVAALGSWPIGIDLVFFDAEEFVWDPEQDELVLGSTTFADALNSPSIYSAAIVVDIVGRPGLVLSPDSDSDAYHPALVDEIWKIGERFAPSHFSRQVRYQILDDHIPLLERCNPAALIMDA